MNPALTEKFIELSFIHGKTYSELEIVLNLSRQQIQELWNGLSEERDKINKVKKIYSRKKIKEVTFPLFYKMYSAQGGKCHYCEITQEQITQFYASGKILKSKRATRGQTLELERLQPDLSYDKIENLKLACYWCNNAKSDQFSEEEFKVVGKAIAQVWKQRLANS